MEKTKQELLKEANDELSQACFERGRIYFEIKQDSEAIAKKKLRAHNMDIEFKKISERFKKALSAQQEEARAAKPDQLKAVPDISLEMKPEAILESPGN